MAPPPPLDEYTTEHFEPFATSRLPQRLSEKWTGIQSAASATTPPPTIITRIEQLEEKLEEAISLIYYFENRESANHAQAISFFSNLKEDINKLNKRIEENFRINDFRLTTQSIARDFPARARTGRGPPRVPPSIQAEVKKKASSKKLGKPPSKKTAKSSYSKNKLKLKPAKKGSKLKLVKARGRERNLDTRRAWRGGGDE